MGRVTIKVHADAPHHLPGFLILRFIDAHEVVQFQGLKSVREDGVGPLRGESLSPGARIKSPANLDRRHDFGQKEWHRKTDVTNELFGPLRFCGERPSRVRTLSIDHPSEERLSLIHI